MNRFKVLTAVVLSSAIFAGVLGGCAPKAPTGGADGGTGNGAGATRTGVTINVFNWGDYIDESVLKTFQQETGISVKYSTYSTNEDMYTKIKNGGSNYDIIVPTDYMVSRMIREGMLEELDFNNIPNFSNIDERIKNRAFDPGNKYSVPYLWGTMGIIYNKKMVTEPVDSWDILWDQKYKGQIFMYESSRDVLGMTLIKLGLDLNTQKIDELNRAKEELIRQKPLVQAYVAEIIKDKMIGNEGALGYSFAGDAYYSMKENEDLDYAIPKEGTILWFDNLLIPKGSKNKKEAEMFINFLCRPDIALKNTEFAGYSTPNKAAFEMLPDEDKNCPAYWPPDDVFENGKSLLDVGDFAKEFAKAWTEILASK